MLRLAYTLGLVAALASTTDADTIADPVATYALVIGSNAGGAGQAMLQFAEDDARRVANILTELGGYAPSTVELVLRPTPQLVRQKLAQLADAVRVEIAAGRQARLFFYYSGHARASAIDFGTEQLALEELRQRLLTVPATLTIVVLDACQSGAFSRVKGATPASDFSFSSREQLGVSGVAVLASSSGSELSQESERLRSSYFTHHLLVGMRGAGDSNDDGKVTIDEAYRYAYHQTLLATAETAVGGQHVSLEVDLKGHGDVAVSFPRRSTAAIELPAALEGKVLVEDRRAQAVVAETSKARGAAVRIAVSPGAYHVLVRRGNRLARCAVMTAAGSATTIDLGRCRSEAVVEATRKGGGLHRPTRFEVTALAGGERADAYTKTLDSFGYFNHSSGLGLGIAGMRRLHSYLWVGASGGLEKHKWTRDVFAPPMPSELRFEWWTASVRAIAHTEHPVLGHWAAYARIGGGLGVARTRFVELMKDDLREQYFGPALTMGGGLHRQASALGFVLGYQFDYAPLIDNLAGETHASGGHRVVIGASLNL